MTEDDLASKISAILLCPIIIAASSWGIFYNLDTKQTQQLIKPIYSKIAGEDNTIDLRDKRKFLRDIGIGNILLSEDTSFNIYASGKKIHVDLEGKPYSSCLSSELTVLTREEVKDYLAKKE